MSASDIEPRPIPPAIEPTQPKALNSNELLRRVASDLTPFQSVRVSRQIARGRMKTAAGLARIENETVLGEAAVIAKAKIQSTTEQTERLLHVERMECLEDVAIRHDQADRIIGLVKDEVGRSIFKDALMDASARYASSVVRRSRS